jgi:hypothetical protein
MPQDVLVIEEAVRYAHQFHEMPVDAQARIVTSYPDKRGKPEQSVPGITFIVGLATRDGRTLNLKVHEASRTRELMILAVAVGTSWQSHYQTGHAF